MGTSITRKGCQLASPMSIPFIVFLPSCRKRLCQVVSACFVRRRLAALGKPQRGPISVIDVCFGPGASIELVPSQWAETGLRDPLPAACFGPNTSSFSR